MLRATRGQRRKCISDQWVKVCACEVDFLVEGLDLLRADLLVGLALGYDGGA